MSNPAPSSPDLAAPPHPLARLDALDLLRGIAILGIFVMNTQSMSMPQQAYMNPAAYNPSYIPGQGFPDGFTLNPLTGLNFYVYSVVHILADMKFITIFSILFGAGIALQASRAAHKNRNPWAVHYARMATLLLIGLCHAYLLWYGDILVTYALCGILLAPLRKLPPALLSSLGIFMIIFITLISLSRTQHWDWQWITTVDNFSADLYRGGIEKELAAYRAAWPQQMHHRLFESFRGETAEFLTWTFFRCGGCLLLGFALQRRRFFHGDWSAPNYALLASLLIPLGWTLSLLGIFYNQANNWSEEWGAFQALWGLGVEFNYYGSLLAALGYISLGTYIALLAARHAPLASLLTPIRSVGKMALSNYIFQTLVGTTLFYGHGFGLFGYLSRAELLLYVVLPTWITQLTLSTLYLRHFQQGPLEFLWHTAVYTIIRPTHTPVTGFQIEPTPQK